MPQKTLSVWLNQIITQLKFSQIVE